MKYLWLPFLWLGRVLHWVRLGILNALTLFILILIGFFFFHLKHQPVASEASVLLLHPQGRLVYAESEVGLQKTVDKVLGRSSNTVLLRQMVQAIEDAAKDPRIHVLALDLSSFSGGSLTQLDSVARALRNFRQTGKPIYVFAPSYSQDAYLLASQANHILIAPLGMVMIDGFSDYHLYFKNLFNKIGVTVFAFRKGKYKSAVEPLTRTSMSEAAKTENRAWLSVWWQNYLHMIAEGRHLPVAQFRDYADHLSSLLVQSKGNAAALALQQHLVTAIASRRTFHEMVAHAAGESENQLHIVRMQAYLAASEHSTPHRDVVAVVPIDGMLLTGSNPVPNAVVARYTVQQIDALQHEPQVKAVVLQVDSPGGSVTAAESIRQAIVRLRQEGKPVVVSMGTLGASGAYWLSTAANKIYAHRTTIAGDIGVFALIPNFSGTLQKLGVGYSGIGTTPNSNALSPYGPLSASAQSALQAIVDHLYVHFVALVAHSRGLSIKAVAQAAEGRAWAGIDALHLGLIDHIGNLSDSVREAAKLAHLSSKQYQVDYLPVPAALRPIDLVRPWLGTALWGQINSLLGLNTSVQLMRSLVSDSTPYGLYSLGPISSKSLR